MSLNERVNSNATTSLRGMELAVFQRKCAKKAYQRAEKATFSRVQPSDKVISRQQAEKDWETCCTFQKQYLDAACDVIISGVRGYIWIYHRTKAFFC